MAHEPVCCCEQSIRVVVGQRREPLNGVFANIVNLIRTYVHGVGANPMYKQAVFVKPVDVQLCPSTSFVVDF